MGEFTPGSLERRNWGADFTGQMDGGLDTCDLSGTRSPWSWGVIGAGIFEYFNWGPLEVSKGAVAVSGLCILSRGERSGCSRIVGRPVTLQLPSAPNH